MRSYFGLLVAIVAVIGVVESISWDRAIPTSAPVTITQAPWVGGMELRKRQSGSSDAINLYILFDPLFGSLSISCPSNIPIPCPPFSPQLIIQ